MKIKKLINKTGLLFTVTIMIAIYASGQDSYIKSRWNIKAGHARYKTGSFYFSHDNKETVGNYRIEANYGITNFIETGIYFGGSRYKYYMPVDSITFIAKGYFAPFYGTNFNFHLLPFLIKEENFRFDVYLTGKFGGLYYKDKRSGDGIHRVEYALGGGLCFYPWKHFGVYTEYCYGNYLYEDVYNSSNHTKFRYGFTLKF